MKILIQLFCFLFLTSVCLAEDKPLKIFITGSLSPQGMERIGKPINVINPKDIKKISEPTIGETLANQPGVSSTSFGPGASRPVIRGQSNERVRVIENGLENGDVSSVSDDHAVTTDPLTTERIDILRGPSTLMFGSQAIGGVVNVIDDSIAEENIGENVTGKLGFTFGDKANDEFSGSTVLKGQAGSLNWYLSGFGRSTNNIEIPGFAESATLRESELLEEEHGHEGEEEHEEGEHEDEESRGTLENSDTESYGVKAGLSHVWDNGFIGFAVRHNGSEYGIPGGHGHAEEESEGDEDEEEEGPVRIDLEQTRFETRGAVHLHGEEIDSIRFGLSYSDYEHQELEGDEIGTIYDRESFETRVLLTHHHDEYLEGGLGLQINYDDVSAIGEEAFIPSTSNFRPAIFFIEDFSLNNNLIWQFGGRYENSNVNPEEFSSENFNVYSASTGLIWRDLSKRYSTAFNLSYSERAPNAAELFADGVHVASQIFEIGDSDLEKESSLGAELILRKLNGSTRGSFTAFLQEYSDYINLNSQGGEEEGFPVFAYENVDARFWGIEAEVEQDVLDYEGHLLTLSAGFDLVRAKNTDSNQSLPRITPIRTKLGVDYSYKKVSSYVNAVFVEEQERVAQFELPTESYSLLNAGINFSLSRNENQSLDLFIRGTNLTNDEARVHNSFLKDQAPLRGRAFFAGITANF